jgi:hypothetical protein
VVGARHADEVADRADHDVRERLVVVQLGEPEAEVRVPAVEGVAAVLDAVGGPAHHRVVQPAVVQVGGWGRLGVQQPQPGRHRRRDQQVGQHARRLALLVVVDADPGDDRQVDDPLGVLTVVAMQLEDGAVSHPAPAATGD